MNNTTKPTTAGQIIRSWYLVDVKDQVLGRVATQIAHKLMGKAKPYYVRNLDCGDYVVVVNSAKFVVTGRKETEKMYGNYSGYPGGLKEKPLWQVLEEKPREVVRRAVYGMLPKNKLRAKLMTRLYIYPDEKHPYSDKFINKSN